MPRDTSRFQLQGYVDTDGGRTTKTGTLTTYTFQGSETQPAKTNPFQYKIKLLMLSKISFPNKLNKSSILRLKHLNIPMNYCLGKIIYLTSNSMQVKTIDTFKCMLGYKGGCLASVLRLWGTQHTITYADGLAKTITKRLHCETYLAFSVLIHVSVLSQLVLIP